jgi:hypothetical protein
LEIQEIEPVKKGGFFNFSVGTFFKPRYLEKIAKNNYLQPLTIKVGTEKGLNS